MRESVVETYLKRRVVETGGFTRKVQWIGHRGAPDRLCGWPALRRHGLVETKKPKTPQAAAHQAREHERLRSIGFDVRVIATIEAVDAYIREMTGG